MPERSTFRIQTDYIDVDRVADEFRRSRIAVEDRAQLVFRVQRVERLAVRLEDRRARPRTLDVVHVEGVIDVLGRLRIALDALRLGAGYVLVRVGKGLLVCVLVRLQERLGS